MDEVTSDKQIQKWFRMAADLPESRRMKAIEGSKGLYVRLHRSGSQQWLFRYVFGKPRNLVLGHYPELTLSGARVEANKSRVLLDQGKDPAEVKRVHVLEQQLATRQRQNTVAFITNEWLDSDIRGKIASDARVESTVTKYIINRVGGRVANEFRGDDVKRLCAWVSEHGGPTVANDVFRYVRRIYDQAAREQKAGINYNPTAGLRLRDAGGSEEPRERILTDRELTDLFKRMRKSESFGRQNEISVHLILRIGNRKMELLSARWIEFDLDSGEWGQRPVDPTARKKMNTKKKRPVVPLTPTSIRLLKEQKVLSCGSDYVFPARRISKRRRFPHVGPDTLNSALNDLNGEAIHFTVHDLRRTARTLLARFGVIDEVGELCLGHKLKGSKGVYNIYKYFEERRAALMLLENHYAKLLGTAKVELFSF